jgi:hypothetical protein
LPIAQAGLKLATILPQCRDYRCVPPYPVFNFFFFLELGFELGASHFRDTTHLSHSLNSFCFSLLFRWGLVLFAQGQSSDGSPPTSVSQVAGTPGVYYHTQFTI